MHLLAHGLGPVKDLPVPTWLFYWGGAAVLVASFVALGSLWREPLLARHSAGRAGPAWLSRIVLSLPLRVVVQTISVLLFALVFAAAFDGNRDPFKNFAPTWIYVVFWLGIPLLSVLLGDVWRVLSPWRALADGFVWARGLTGRPPAAVESYPERLGRWPAAVALFAFVALELAYKDPSSPFTLAFAMVVYTVLTLFGYATYGRVTWHERGEGFAVAFAYLARMAPLTVAEGRLRFRWPFTGLAGAEPVPGSLAVIAVMLGSVGFDGVSRTRWWQDVIARVKDPFIPDARSTGETLAMLVNLGALLAFCVFVAVAYRVTCAAMRSAVASERSLAPEFVLSLVPIAFVYAVAHYFSLFFTQGAYVIPLLLRPVRARLGPLRHGRLPAEPGALHAPHDLVRAGRRARGRTRGRPRRRPRSRGDALRRPPHGAALAVRDARADGALHRRRALDPLAKLVLASRGTAPADAAGFARRSSPEEIGYPSWVYGR